MHWVTIILIAIAANLDNLGISLAYGVKQTKIPFLSNVTIAIVTMMMTYMSVMAGSKMAQYISPHRANILESILFCAIGLYTLGCYQFAKQESRKNPERIDKDGNNVISIREAMALGFVLSINCLAGGIGVGANRISAIWTVVFIGIFSIVTIDVGGQFGYLLSKTFIGKYATAISGALLLAIGVFEIFIE